jgi:hypothetical protein
MQYRLREQFTEEDLIAYNKRVIEDNSKIKDLTMLCKRETLVKSIGFGHKEVFPSKRGSYDMEL